ncbi:MAG: S8/S53 family peptidase [Bdellovibrio sp.]|nr:S8/S53 family peptidase [Bdellovibrio sp.]
MELEDRQPLQVEDGSLSPFWAQEYVGADLAKIELHKQHDLKPVPFAIYDGGFEKKYVTLLHDIPVDGEKDGNRPIRANHGTSVANVINGPGMMSMSELVDYVQLKRVSPSVYYWTAYKELEKLEVKPQVLSNSMGWDSEEVAEYAKKADAAGIIWVMASGNDHPNPIAEHERTAPTISVGSYSPRGLQTIYSQESDQLDILAPADEYMASMNGSGEKSTFGATSGATPMVSGTIANLKSILPSLNRGTVETILKKTALLSLHSYYSKTNKTGFLNSYKAVLVTARLKEVCGDNADCANQEAQKDATYQFAELPLNPRVAATCISPLKLGKADMMDLRRNFLLNPEKTVYAQMLSCAYKNEHYSINADYYQNMMLIYSNPALLQKKIQKMAVQAVRKGYLNSASLRDLELLDDSFEKTLKAEISHPTGIGSFTATQYLERFKKTVRITLGKK